MSLTQTKNVIIKQPRICATDKQCKIEKKIYYDIYLIMPLVYWVLVDDSLDLSVP